MCRAGRSCAACRFCAGLCDRCPGVCSLLQSWRPCVRLAAIVSAFCGVVFRPTRRLPLLRPACAAPPGPACRLSAVRRGHRIFCCFFHAQPTESSSFFAGVPRLCSRPAGPVACCFFADLCAHCLFACSALFMRVFLLSFALFCLTFASQKSFHLSLRPRRASTFFPFLRPAANLLLFRAAGRLNGPSGRNSPADGETLEKAKEQSSAFSSVSVRRGTPAPFRRSPPFSRCWPA